MEGEACTFSFCFLFHLKRERAPLRQDGPNPSPGSSLGQVGTEQPVACPSWLSSGRWLLPPVLSTSVAWGQLT